MNQINQFLDASIRLTQAYVEDLESILVDETRARDDRETIALFQSRLAGVREPLDMCVNAIERGAK